jgi:hypothetical protein
MNSDAGKNFQMSTNELFQPWPLNVDEHDRNLIGRRHRNRFRQATDVVTPTYVTMFSVIVEKEMISA